MVISRASLIPIPPFKFGCLTTFQFIKWSFLPCVFPPCHRNFLSCMILFFITILEAKRITLLKIGRYERTYLIRLYFSYKIKPYHSPLLDFILDFLKDWVPHIKDFIFIYYWDTKISDLIPFHLNLTPQIQVNFSQYYWRTIPSIYTTFLRVCFPTWSK